MERHPKSCRGLSCVPLDKSGSAMSTVWLRYLRRSRAAKRAHVDRRLNFDSTLHATLLKRTVAHADPRTRIFGTLKDARSTKARWSCTSDPNRRRLARPVMFMPLAFDQSGDPNRGERRRLRRKDGAQIGTSKTTRTREHQTSSVCDQKEAKTTVQKRMSFASFLRALFLPLLS